MLYVVSETNVFFGEKKYIFKFQAKFILLKIYGPIWGMTIYIGKHQRLYRAGW